MDTKFIDWHTADIIAALRKRGTSLAAESRRHGLSSSTWPTPDPPTAKGRINYRDGAGNAPVGDLALALPRSHYP